MVVQITASDPKPGTGQQSGLQNVRQMTEFTGPPSPPQFIQRYESEVPLEGNSEQSKAFPVQKSRSKKHSDKRKHKYWAKYVTSSSSSSESEVSMQVKKPSKHKGHSSEPNKSKLDPDPVFTGK